MSKKLCKKEEDYKIPETPKIKCKKCGRLSDKKDKVCKPVKNIKDGKQIL